MDSGTIAAVKVAREELQASLDLLIAVRIAVRESGAMTPELSPLTMAEISALKETTRSAKAYVRAVEAREQEAER